MTVFKAFFQLAKRNLGAVALYLGIMVMMTVIITASKPENMSVLSVSTENYRIAIHNFDEGDPVSADLVQSLQERSQVMEIATDDKDIKDALFWRDVDYVVQIPKGFGQSLLGGAPIKIATYASPNDYTHMYIDNQVNAFIGTMLAYRESGKLSAQEMLAHTKQDLISQTELGFAQQSTEPDWLVGISYYFRYLSYPLLAALATGMGYVLSEMLKQHNVLRVRASSMGETRFNLSLAFSAAAFGLCILLVLIIGGFLSMQAPMSALTVPKFQLMLLSAVLYTLLAISLTLLITAFTRHKGALSGIINVVSLGSSFLGGVFVPVELLGSGLINLSKFIPAYWYTAAVDKLILSTTLESTVMAGYWKDMGVLALMVAVLLAGTLLINKYKRQKAI